MKILSAGLTSSPFLDPNAKTTNLGAAAGMPKIEIERVTTTTDTGASATA